REFGWRLAAEAFRVALGRVVIGRASLADLERVSRQCEAFLEQKLEAEDEVLEQQRTLAELLGLGEGGPSLVPSDSPPRRVAPFNLDCWRWVMEEALACMPRFLLSRERLQGAEKWCPVARRDVKDDERKTLMILGLRWRRVATAPQRIEAARAE